MQPTEPPEAPKSAWAKRLGPLGGLLVLLSKGKGLLLALANLKTVFSIAAFLGVYWALYGWWFALGFVLSIAIHEMGHYLTVRAYGLQAEAPVFIPGLGAYVKWQGVGVDAVTRARIALAGPLFGFFAALTAFLLYRVTGQGVWLAVAHTGAWLNLLNMIPVFIFDGASAMSGLGRPERVGVIGAAAVMWFLFGEMLLLFVALAAAYRFYKNDVPETPSPSTGAYFIGLMGALCLLSWICKQSANGVPTL